MTPRFNIGDLLIISSNVPWYAGNNNVNIGNIVIVINRNRNGWLTLRNKSNNNIINVLRVGKWLDKYYIKNLQNNYNNIDNWIRLVKLIYRKNN